MSIRAYAAHLGVAAATVANWDGRGDQARLRTETQQILDVDLARAPDDVRRRFEATIASPGQEKASSTPTAEADDRGNDAPASAGNDSSNSGIITETIRAFRETDSRMGGARVYADVLTYLRAHVGTWLIDSADIGESTTLCAAASLLEMAGWMAHDRGDDDAAEAHFGRSHAFSVASCEPYLQAHVLGSMSHLSAHLGRPRDTVRLAQRGHTMISGHGSDRELTARLLALEARGTAALGHIARARDLLACAESTLAEGGSPDELRVPWISRYDEASLASDASRCLRRLGDLDGALIAAERIVAMRPKERARSRGLGQLTLACVLVGMGDIARACVVAEEALSADLPIESAPVARGLSKLRESLTPHLGNAAAADEVHRQLTAALDRRNQYARELGLQLVGSGE